MIWAFCAGVVVGVVGLLAVIFLDMSTPSRACFRCLRATADTIPCCDRCEKIARRSVA